MEWCYLVIAVAAVAVVVAAVAIDEVAAAVAGACSNTNKKSRA